MCPSPRGACLVLLRALGGRPSSRASPRLLPIPPSSSPTSVGRPCPSRRQCPEAPVEDPSLVTVSHRRLGAGAAQPRQAVADALCFPALALSSRCHLSVPTAPSALPPGASAPSAGRGPPLCLCPALGKGPESLSRPWEGALLCPHPRIPPPGRTAQLPWCLFSVKLPWERRQFWSWRGCQDASPNPPGSCWPRGGAASLPGLSGPPVPSLGQRGVRRAAPALGPVLALCRRSPSGAACRVVRNVPSLTPSSSLLASIS